MRNLGNTVIEVSPLCFGGNVFGWTIDEAKSFEILDGFTDAGLNFIDTANVYSIWAPGHIGGESETIIGNWLKKSGKREKIVIATKVGMDMGEGNKGLSPAYIVKAVEESLKRLQTDYIDLYQSHTDDADTPLEETLSTYAKLIEQGKVRAIGASNYQADRLNESLEISKKHNFPAYQTLQPLYNLFDRVQYEKDLQQVCVDNHIGVITYFSLASGFLTGKYRSEKDFSKSQRGQGMKKYMNDRGFKILKALDEVAGRVNANPAQVALAWLIARPGVTAPIVSATSIEQLQDLIKATELKLSSDDMDTLNVASA